jgi:flagellar biosynthesis GTPase FlhF
VANRDAEGRRQLQQMLAALPGTQPVLLLAASAQDAVQRECIAQWRETPGLCVTLTRIDETDCIGGAMAELIVAGLPLCALSDGPRVPEDLAAAAAATIGARLLKVLPPALRATTGDRQHAA